MNLRKNHLLMLKWYVFFVSLALIIMLTRLFLSISPLVVMLTFLLMIFWPGFVLSRIFKISFKADFLEQLILWLSLGLIFDLTISFLAIFLGLAIVTLVKFYLILTVVLFILAFFLDFFRRDTEEEFEIIHFKELFKSENLIYLFLFVLIILVLITINQVGGNFNGDPQYHIAIMRKAIDNLPLTVDNLSFVKNKIDLAYGIPVWHVFLTLVAKILNINILVMWQEVAVALTFMVFLVWSWFFRKILPNRQIAVLAFLLFIVYYFPSNGYFYERLAVPDTFCQLLLLPLSFGLAIEYIFNKESLPRQQAGNFKHLLVVTILVFFMGLIHWAQYFYFLLTMGLFGIIYALAKYRDPDFRAIIKKIILVIFTNFILVVPALIFLELKSQTVSEDLKIFTSINTVFRNNSFIKFSSYVQISFLFLPFVILFSKKYYRLFFILAVFLVGPLVFNIPYLSDFLVKYLSPIFVKRLYTNLGEWPYVIWALALSFIFVLMDKFIKFGKLSSWIINSILGVFLGGMVILELYFHTVSGAYNKVFSDTSKVWLGDNYCWLISAVVLAALILFFLQKYNSKWSTVFGYSDYQNKTTILMFTLIIVVFLGSRSISDLRTNFSNELSNHRFISKVSSDPTWSIVDEKRLGGKDTINFIQNNIPAKSIFNASGPNNMILPMVVDMYAASFPFGQESTGAYQNIYKKDVPIKDKLKSLSDGKIEYVLYVYPKNKPSPFESYPQYFTKIYDNGNATIYKIEKDQVNADLIRK